MMETVRKRWKAHLAAAVLAFSIVSPIGYMFFDNAPPIDLTDTYIVPGEVYSGDVVTVFWTATEHRICKTVIYRVWNDASGVPHAMLPEPGIPREYKIGVTRRLPRDVNLPYGMAPGLATMTGWREYSCNWLQNFWPIRVPILPAKVWIIGPRPRP